MIGRATVALVLAGWLADALAATDSDVDAAIAAHEAGEHDRALELLGAAEARLGERPEIHLDRGLFQLAENERDGAKISFQRATEADDLAIRASGHYELGNLAFDAEDWDGAIAAYVECLRARPDHEHAKWNLELARLRKQAAEEEKKKDEEDEQDTDGQPPQDTDGEPQPPQDTDGQQQPEQDTEGQQQPEGTEGGQGEPPKPEEQQGQPEEPEPEPSQEPQPAPAQPLDRADLDEVLRQLDGQDEFRLGRPQGRTRPPAKDW